ncbi:Ras guanine nucleotide exchange factor [Reticulomyxa filosa]|uniref:Ras guanine nucleotide exchange factor n=1 Tax=Reticulomyxa filosa TaxID=46433 RepID=X6MI67_RETFI|nr:Ras guanine nucleotide exchange factor [Reticulomyxa filosa]|eukprot:ETO13127.1 Ras guanine nucleotide exchange factor [Reticulomyxa filosa]
MTHDKLNRAPNVVNMIFFCESISSWVQFEIIAEKPANRYRTYEKFIRIAKELDKINNQYGLLQVFAGLDSHYVCRFKNLETVNIFAFVFFKKKRDGTDQFWYQ